MSTNAYKVIIVDSVDSVLAHFDHENESPNVFATATVYASSEKEALGIALKTNEKFADYLSFLFHEDFVSIEAAVIWNDIGLINKTVHPLDDILRSFSSDVDDDGFGEDEPSTDLELFIEYRNTVLANKRNNSPSMIELELLRWWFEGRVKWANLIACCEFTCDTFKDFTKQELERFVSLVACKFITIKM